MPLPTPITESVNFYHSVRSIILSAVWRAFAPDAVEEPSGRLHSRHCSGRSAVKFFFRNVIGLLALTVFASITAFARNPDTPQRIPLTPFGYQAISERYLLQGATMFTVDFVDNSHLLVTFGISRLMPRLPDCPADDEDRTVKAVLVEIPSGKEVASTEWRFHDLGQYLWNLGEGHFLLRNRDTLTTLTPLQNITRNAFEQQPFLHFNRRIAAVIVSADRDLLTIETVKPKAHAARDPMLQISAQASTQTATPANPPGLQRRDPDATPSASEPVEISFIRLLHTDPTRIVAQLNARIRTEKAVSIPLTTEGFLETRAESHDGVLFHFITYAGKDLDLGDFPTSCHPRPTFVSKSEFVTYGCRGSDDSLDLTGFNLRGDMIWQINFSDSQAYPSFASAPAAGRFAFSRTITTSNVFGSETPSMSQLTAQEIRVIQMYNGKQLLRAVASPIQRAGQNYALAPDGLTLAVIHDIPAQPPAKGEKPSHDPAVELFKLPAFTPKDLAEMKTEAAMTPPQSNAPMRFSLKEIKEALNPAPAADSAIVGDSLPSSTTPPQAAPQPAAIQPATAQSTAPSASGRIVGDPPASSKTDQTDSSAEPEKRSKPPTLYEPAPPTSPLPQ